MRRTLLLALAAAAFVAALAGGGSDARAQETTTIGVSDFYFCDSSFEAGVCETTVNVGDTVVWEWSGAAVQHTTTECGGDLDNCPEPHLWDSPAQSSGDFSYTFDEAGTFSYRCQIHPTLMQGVISVVAAQEATPTPTPEPSTPEATETPAADGEAAPTAAPPSEVPAGGGAPPGDGGLSATWWAIAAGCLALLAGGVFVVGRQRR